MTRRACATLAPVMLALVAACNSVPRSGSRPPPLPSATGSPRIGSGAAPPLPAESTQTIELVGAARIRVVAGSGEPHELVLGQDPVARSSLEQTSGEKVRSLALNLVGSAGGQRARFRISGRIAAGESRTGEGFLAVTLLAPGIGANLLSTDGECTVRFTAVSARRVDATVACPPTRRSRVELTGAVRAPARF
ncbi:MAG: hypothetical protein ABR520_07695 [Mycobacteriales bacterium]|nr:hypothetical protein [Frankia sp.]MCA1833582.1 hypothetical protein [Actinomycetota bacterium]